MSATVQKTAPLISGASPTIFITDMDRAVRFYGETLGLEIAHRAGNHFCMIDAGGGCQIGLHPPGPNTPPPGASGSTQVGLNVVGSIEDVVRTLTTRGVKFLGPVINDGNAVKLAFFDDPDGNVLYLCEVKH
jgi:predicted enzyme related to lactoylglutathione lyase